MALQHRCETVARTGFLAIVRRTGGRARNTFRINHAHCGAHERGIGMPLQRVDRINKKIWMIAVVVVNPSHEFAANPAERVVDRCRRANILLKPDNLEPRTVVVLQNFGGPIGRGIIDDQCLEGPWALQGQDAVQALGDVSLAVVDIDDNGNISCHKGSMWALETTIYLSDLSSNKQFQIGKRY